MGLPVITFDNAWTMPQERYNTRWIEQQQLGMVLRAQRDLAAAVPALIEQLPEFRQRVAEVPNRAVFEVVDTFERLMQGAEALGLPTPAGQPPAFEASATTPADIAV
jgi:hypothetical protein